MGSRIRGICLNHVAREVSVFHLCSDYAKQRLYSELLKAISTPSVLQYMYVPVRSAAEIDIGRIDNNSTIEFRFTHLLRRYHRVMFRSKIRCILRDLLAETPIRNADVVHAHFLYSDGAAALAIHRLLGVPYVVAVRNTDVNAFMRFRPDLNGIRNDVLRFASRVIFLSPAYAEAVIQKLPGTLRSLVSQKTEILPNGLTDDWLRKPRSEYLSSVSTAGTLKLLYVGDFTPNKNVEGILAAHNILRKRRPTTLTIVGGGGDANNKVARRIRSQSSNGVVSLGRINDVEHLKLIYSSHDVFLMPSFRETFGLTYVEALSQGLPIVHSRGQGVDGYFSKNTVSSAVDPNDPESIAQGVLNVAKRLPGVRDACRDAAQNFNWKKLGDTYRDIYYSITGDLS